MDLTSFDISPERGFLPRCDPLATLPRHWPAVLNDLAQALPKLLAARQFRPYVDALRESWSNSLGKRDLDELRSAARILSFAGHGYVWEDPHQPADRIPASLAVRSEEHTSELQSPCNLVCRLLLEKKKITMAPLPTA